MLSLGYEVIMGMFCLVCMFCGLAIKICKCVSVIIGWINRLKEWVGREVSPLALSDSLFGFLFAIRDEITAQGWLPTSEEVDSCIALQNMGVLYQCRESERYKLTWRCQKYFVKS